MRKSILIDEKTHVLLKEYCAERGLKMNYIIEDYILKLCKKPTNILMSKKS